MYKTEIAVEAGSRSILSAYTPTLSSLSLFLSPLLQLQNLENNRRSKETLSRHVLDFLFNDSIE